MSNKHRTHTMLRREWQHLRTHPILAASLSVILLIPIMYAGFFLGSVWNPYGNTGNLPVAVVNNDTGAEFAGTQTVIGDQLVDTLKHNSGMGWHFVSEAEADKGIENGTYYMKLVIPADFSKNAATVTTEHPTASTLTYTTTPSKNFIASLLTAEAAKSVKQEVATSINKAYVQALLAALQSTADGVQTAADGASSLATGSQSLQSGISEYTDGVSRLTEGQRTLTNGLAALNTGTTTLKNGTDTLAGQLPTKSQITQLTNGVNQIQTGIAQLQAGVTTPQPELVAAQNAVKTDAANLAQSLGAYQSQAANSSASISALSSAAASGGPTATVSTSDLAAVLGLLNTSQHIAQQSGTLLGNLATLTTTLTAQQTQLATSVTSLRTGMDSLAPNLTTALGGYTAVASGAQSLGAGADQLHMGAHAAHQGSQQVLSGLQLLGQNSAPLQSGAGQLTDGSTQLSNSLVDASQKLGAQPTGSATLDHIAEPLTLKEDVRGDVPNYGYALSPYVLSLGLYVGALVFNVIYPVRRVFSRPENARRWWFSKMSIAFSVSIGQALVLCAVMVWGLGLQPDHPWLFVLLTIIASLSFMSVVTLLVVALDNVGRFLAMLLLVLQLGSSEGVFPIVLSSGFFQFMNPFMPMTYSIHAYREAISSGLGLQVYWNNVAVLIAIGVVSSLCMILFLRLHGMKQFKHEYIDEEE